MPVTETAGNPAITHGDDDEWVAATLTRIDANLAGLERRLDHLDTQIHGISHDLQPLREHAEAIARAVRMLDRAPKWMKPKP